jgi:long-subunit fatty acid transport protein
MFKQRQSFHEYLLEELFAVSIRFVLTTAGRAVAAPTLAQGSSGVWVATLLPEETSVSGLTKTYAGGALLNEGVLTSWGNVAAMSRLHHVRLQ